MAFMVPEYLEDTWYEIDTTAGITAVPQSVTGKYKGKKDDPKAIYKFFGDYLEVFKADDVWSLEVRKKAIGVRLQAPGYLDATDWSVFDTDEEAREYLRDNYEVDPDTGDDLEDEDEDEDEGPPDEDELQEAIIVEQKGDDWIAYYHRREIVREDNEGRFWAEVHAWGEQNNYFPNIYQINDHGNVDRLDDHGKILKSWV